MNIQDHIQGLSEQITTGIISDINAERLPISSHNNVTIRRAWISAISMAIENYIRIETGNEPDKTDMKKLQKYVTEQNKNSNKDYHE